MNLLTHQGVPVETPPVNHDPAKTIRDLLTTQVQCVLSTIDEDTPNQHLMAFALEPSLTDVYIASERATKKVANLLRNPAVSLLWDNRTGNTRDHVHGLAVTAQGQASLLNGWARARVEHLLLARNPELATLFSGNEAAVFALRIQSYRLVQGYDSVTAFIPGGSSELPRMYLSA
jgi:nitroimidazol reductase NimA-like FMN-containing flavoprotein (pyridoxamine 5'-phosphate oxidase superfamily)